MLERLTQLEELDWDSTGGVVFQMYRSGHRRTLALRKLQFDGDDFRIIEDEGIADVIKLCPLLNEVTIEEEYAAPSRQDMQALLQLSSVSSA